MQDYLNKCRQILWQHWILIDNKNLSTDKSRSEVLHMMLQENLGVIKKSSKVVVVVENLYIYYQAVYWLVG